MRSIIVFFGLLTICSGNEKSFTNICVYDQMQSEFATPHCCTEPLSIEARAHNSFQVHGNMLAAKITFTYPEERGNFPEVEVHCDSRSYFRDAYDLTLLADRTYTFIIELQNFDDKCTVEIRSYETCCDKTCRLEINAPIFADPSSGQGSENTTLLDTSSAISTSTVTEGYFTTHSQIDNTEDKADNFVYYVLATTFTFMVVLVLFYFIYRFHVAQKAMKSKFYEIDILPKFSLNVFLVFLDEHPLHKNVVLKFANYLKENFDFNILLDLYDRKTIYANPAEWLDKTLSSSDVVVVMWSPGVEERWNNLEKFNDRLDLLTPVLSHVKKDIILGKNATKYIFANFDYWNEIPKVFQVNTIPWVRLMDEFYSFCKKVVHVATNLKKCNQSTRVLIRKKCVKSERSGAATLEKSISEMRTVLQNNKVFTI